MSRSNCKLLCMLSIGYKSQESLTQRNKLHDSGLMQNLMDGKSCCNLMDKLSISTDTQCVQLPRPFCADPLVMFHMYPETPNQVTCSEDLSFLPFMPEHLITENFYSEPCGFSYQMPHSSYSRSEYSYGPAFIRKRNERERQRVKCVNEGYAKLRHHLPKEYLEKRLSKVETLRAAIKYISLAGSCLCKVAHSEGFLPMDHRYCNAMPALDKFPCSSAIPAVHHCCRSSFAMHPAWITKPLAPLRCQWIGCCLPSPGPAWQRLSTLQRSVILDKNVPVLVRGERDGFYYRGTVKEEIENERGMFLVEFTRPLQSHGRHSVCVQKTAKDDILEYANGMKHSLLPGDKVLAPWEPDLVRFGPGTVLTGIETRDPLRASEDEEILVQFWNDKKVKLPRGVALWIPPSLCGRIVEMIHMPFSSRIRHRGSPDTNPCIFSCSPKTTLVPVCVAHSLTKHNLLCSPCWPLLHCCGGGVCCSSACVRCFCCCHGHSDVWWPLPPRSQVFQREAEGSEPSSKSSPHLLELEGPKQEELAAVATRTPSSDSESDPELSPTQNAAVDSTVNTDPSHPEKPRLEESAGPQWKYWRRSHCKSRASNSGTGTHSSTGTNGKLESKAISVVDMSRVAPPDWSAVFETTEHPPRGPFTMKEILKYQDFKLSSGEEGSVASGKQRYKSARKKTESDNKHEAACSGKDKLGNTDCISKEWRGKISRAPNKAERDMIHQNSVTVQLMKFKS